VLDASGGCGPVVLGAPDCAGRVRPVTAWLAASIPRAAWCIGQTLSS